MRRRQEIVPAQPRLLSQYLLQRYRPKKLVCQQSRRRPQGASITMPQLTRCDMCLRRFSTEGTVNPVNREELIALKSSLVFPLQIDPTFCYKLHFWATSDEFYWIDNARFEVLHNPTRCEKSDFQTTSLFAYFIHNNEYTQYSFVHFAPNLSSKSCDCLMVLTVNGHNNKEQFKERLFFQFALLY